MSCRIGDHRLRDRVPTAADEGSACDCGKFVVKGGVLVSSGSALKGR
jgi:hypothetical protein